MKRHRIGALGTHVAVLGLAIGLVSLGACGTDEDDLVMGDEQAAFAKKDCPNPKKCPEPPPEPPGEPTEPDFPGTSLDALHSPLRMALTPAGRLLVSDPVAKAVFTVDPVTRLPDGILQIDGAPFAVGYLDGEVYVGNSKDRTIEVYSATGSRRRSFGRDAVGFPIDLDAHGGSGLVYVIDSATQTSRPRDLPSSTTNRQPACRNW